MARPKDPSKFLTKEESEKFAEKLTALRGKKFYTFVASIMGTAYGTIRTKFIAMHVDKAIKENVDRYFENEELKIENRELKEKLEKIREESK